MRPRVRGHRKEFSNLMVRHLVTLRIRLSYRTEGWRSGSIGMKFNYCILYHKDVVKLQ